MNYSYIMGTNNINELDEKEYNLEKNSDGDYLVSFKDDKIDEYENFIKKNLNNGFWNEYLGKDKVFMFKFEDGTFKKYVLDDSNEQEILELCRKFANCEFESVDKMLRDNEYYANSYYKE